MAWGPTGPRTEPMAVASLVTSGACALASFMCCLGLVGSIVGIVLGVMARSRIKASQGQLTGDGLAIAGIVVGIAGVGLYVLMFALMATGSFFTTLR